MPLSSGELRCKYCMAPHECSKPSGLNLCPYALPASVIAFLRQFLWAYASAHPMASHYGIQENLLAAIAAEEWFDGSANQAMRFGGFPDWAEELVEGIRAHFNSEEARSCSCTLF